MKNTKKVISNQAFIIIQKHLNHTSIQTYINCKNGNIINTKRDEKEVILITENIKLDGKI